MDEHRSRSSDTRITRIQDVTKRVIRDGMVTATSDDTVHTVFPVAVSPTEAGVLLDWVRRENPVHTIEIGLGYGISALHICQGLLFNANQDTKHVVIDPGQKIRFSLIGLQLLEEAGVRDIVEYHDAESQFILPQFLKEGRCYDFGFVDGHHRFDKVFLDLFYLGRLLRRGSVIILDDYDWPGIKKAVSFFVTNLDWTIEDIFAESVAVRTPVEPDHYPGTHFIDF